MNSSSTRDFAVKRHQLTGQNLVHIKQQKTYSNAPRTGDIQGAFLHHKSPPVMKYLLLWRKYLETPKKKKMEELTEYSLICETK